MTLDIARPDARPDISALLSGGGQGTWHFQLVDELGNGAVFHWGFGHPAARQGANGPAQDFPSFGLALFSRPPSGTTTTSIAFHNVADPKSVVWEGPRWMYPGVQIEALRDLKAQVVIARFNLELPGGEKLTGHIEMGGVPRRASDDEREDALGISPLTGYAEGRALLEVEPKAKLFRRVDKRHFHLAGRAGLYRAISHAPLPPLSVARCPSGNLERWRVGDVGLLVDTEGMTSRGDADEHFMQLESRETFLSRDALALDEVLARTPMQIPVRAIVESL